MGLEAGQVIGRYELVEKLGAGSFAEVWKALETSDVGFTKEVALKIVRQEDRDPDELDDSLLKEAQLCANLRHPNIVDILGVEEIDGAIQVAMEFVEGGTLSDLIAKVRSTELLIPQSVILDIGIGICRALHRAHTFSDAEGDIQPIIHRDLKPSNILMSRDGVPKIADFGLAKASGVTTATATGTLKGTPAYIAPELWEGGRTFEPRIDLFAVGCILWELIQLERLFAGQTLPQIYVKVVRRDPSEEAAQCRHRFGELVPVIEKLLQRDPEQRYNKASAVLNDLQRLRKSSFASGEIGDFMDLISLTDLPEDERDLSHSSQFQLPETTDPAWHAVIAEALGKDVPLDPSFGDVDVGEVRGGAASGGHRLADEQVTTAELAAEASGSFGRLEVGVGETVVLSRSGGRGIAQPRAGEESQPKERSGWKLLALALGLPGVLALAWFTLGPGAAGDAAEDPRPTDAPEVAAGLNPEGTEGQGTEEQGTEEQGTEDQGTEEQGTEDQGAEAGTEGTGENESPESSAGSPPDPVAEPPSETDTQVAGADSPTPEPRREPEKEPEPERVAETKSEARSEPKRGPAADAPPPALGSKESCLLLTSNPPGLFVWIDGTKQGRRAGRAPTKLRHGPGTVRVGMGASDSASATVDAALLGGAATAVHCDLVTTGSCRAKPADSELCR